MLSYEDATVLLPESLAYEQAAPVLCAGYSAWGAIRAAETKPGARVAVVGIGGVGHLALQYAKAAGFETVAVTHSPDKLALIRELGSDLSVSGVEQLKSVGGADVILLTGNSYKFAGRTLSGLRPGGCIVLVGISDEPLEITSDLLFRRGRVIGSGHNGHEYLYEALDWVASGRVKVMTELYKLDEMERAYEKVAAGTARFKAVMVN